MQNGLCRWRRLRTLDGVARRQTRSSPGRILGCRGVRNARNLRGMFLFYFGVVMILSYFPQCHKVSSRSIETTSFCITYGRISWFLLRSISGSDVTDQILFIWGDVRYPFQCPAYCAWLLATTDSLFHNPVCLEHVANEWLVHPFTFILDLHLSNAQTKWNPECRMQLVRKCYNSAL